MIFWRWCYQINLLIPQKSVSILTQWVPLNKVIFRFKNMLYLHLHHHMTQHGAEEKLFVRGQSVSASEDLPRAEALYPTGNLWFLQTQSWFLYQSLNSALYFEINNCEFLSLWVALCVNCWYPWCPFFGKWQPVIKALTNAPSPAFFEAIKSYTTMTAVRILNNQCLHECLSFLKITRRKS